MTQWTEPPVSSLHRNVVRNARDAGTLPGDDLSSAFPAVNSSDYVHSDANSAARQADAGVPDRDSISSGHLLNSSDGLVQQIFSPAFLGDEERRIDAYHSGYAGQAVHSDAPGHHGHALNIMGTEALSLFRDGEIPRLFPLSSVVRAQATFKEMVENSHLYQGPLFSALGRFIQDGCVLQCVAYQRKPVPDYQHRVPSLGNCLDDLSFHFHEQPVDGLNPSAPNWVSVQDLTTSSMAPKLKQAVWCMSKIVLSNQRAELEGGFFTCLQQKRDLCSLQNGEQLPVYSVRPTAPDAVVLPHHNIQFILGLNRDSFLKIVGIYREEFRLRMCNLMEDWLVVFVALLDHFSQPSKQCVLNAYWEYFIALAEIEEQAALYAGVLSYEDMLYTQMKRSGQKAANEMFRSLQQHMDFPLRFPMRIETENTRIFGDMMSRWAIGAYAMPAHTYHRYQDYFYPSIARERKRLTQTLKSVETITGRIVPANIPGYTAPDIVRQVWSYHSEPHSRPFSLFI